MNEVPTIQLTQDVIQRLTIARLACQVTELEEVCIALQRRVNELETVAASTTESVEGG